MFGAQNITETFRLINLETHGALKVLKPTQGEATIWSNRDLPLSRGILADSLKPFTDSKFETEKRDFINLGSCRVDYIFSFSIICEPALEAVIA